MLNQSNQNLILETIETISSWDLDDEYLGPAIAELLAGTELDSFDTNYDIY